MNTSGPTRGSAGIPECPGIEPPTQSSEPGYSSQIFGAWPLGVSVGLLCRALAGPQDVCCHFVWTQPEMKHFLTSLYSAKSLNCPPMALGK